MFPAHHTQSEMTYPKELAETGVVGFARSALGIFEIFGEPETQDLQHAIDGVVGGSDGDKGIWAV